MPFNYKDLVDAHSPGRALHRRRERRGQPWVPFGDSAAIKHLAFDVRQNAYSNILWMKGPGTIGTHFHRGTVTMVCITGRSATSNTTGSPRRAG